MGHHYFRAALALLCLATVSCAPLSWLAWRSRVPAPAPVPPGPLAGRLIVLDPGHGGEWSGAVTANGVREADVNLRVALRLEQLLEAAGATVVLTRYEDRDLVPAGQPRSLAIDLAERYQLANRYNTDLFVSIHHNASPARGNAYNATETFYKLGDDRCSRDAARYIHGYLVDHLAIPREGLVPGNFSVLRNSLPPAFLGEAFYLTDRRADSLVADEAFLDHEAAGYGQGILDYFAQGIPAVTRVFLSDSAALRPAVIAAVFCDSLSGCLDPGTIELEVDGRAVKAQYLADRAEVRWPADTGLANGPHAVRVAIRNIHGNAAPQALAVLRVDRPPAALTLTADPPQALTDNAGVVRLEAVVCDSFGLPVADGRRVRFGSPDTRLRYEYDVTDQGRARTYCTTPLACTLRVAAVCGELAAVLFLPPAPAPAPVINGFVAESYSGPFLDSVRVLLADSLVALTNDDGFYTFTPAGKPADTLVWFRVPGYLPQSRVLPATGKTQRVDVLLAPAFHGLLHGKTIVLDPAGPADSAGSAANLNQLTAAWLRDYLAQAGAQVRLTSALGRTLSPYEKVKLANECRAQAFISLRHTAGSDTLASDPSIGRYYLGGEGARLAGLVAEELKAVAGLAVRDIADFSYVVMQTGCPAVVISTPSVLPAALGPGPATAARCGKEAYAMFSALVRFYAGVDSTFDREYRGTALDRRTGKPPAEAVIVLDDFLTVPVERDGKYLLRCLQPGEHVLRVMAGKNCLKEEKIAVP